MQSSMFVSNSTGLVNLESTYFDTSDFLCLHTYILYLLYFNRQIALPG